MEKERETDAIQSSIPAFEDLYVWACGEGRKIERERERERERDERETGIMLIVRLAM